MCTIHARLIEETGGSGGLSDQGSLESALAAAENRYNYEKTDLITCAATYAFHLTQARVRRWQQTHRSGYYRNISRK